MDKLNNQRMPKFEEKQNIINKIWSNCIQIIDVTIANNIQGHSSALNPFKLGKSREKPSELIIAAHSTIVINEAMHVQCCTKATST